MAAPRVTIIGVGNLIEVIWPTIDSNVGGDDVASRVIGVTADASDVERKAAHFGFEVVLDDNLEALRRNHPDIIMFAPPPTVAPELIESVLRPYYAERRASSGPLPVLYAFPPVPPGRAYLDALGADVSVVNIIPNNVTTIADTPIEDEGYYVCTFPSPWPEGRLDLLRTVFDGQGAFIQLEPHQLIPMLGAAATVSALWFAVPVIADYIEADHNEVGHFLRARLNHEVDNGVQPPEADFLATTIEAWHAGVKRYYTETDIDPLQAQVLVARGFDLTLHTIAAEPRDVLTGHSVGAATKGGVLEKAIDLTRSQLLPEVQAELAAAAGSDWGARLTGLVVDTCRAVRDHGATLAS